MGLELHCPDERPYDSDLNLPELEWDKKLGPRVIGRTTGFMRYCVKILEELEKFEQCPQAQADRDDLLGVLQFHFEFVCTSLSKHLDTSTSQDDSVIDTVKDSKREFDEERKKFKGLLDKQRDSQLQKSYK